MCGVTYCREGLIKSCWQQEHKARPSAAEVAAFLADWPRLLAPCLDVPLDALPLGDGGDGSDDWRMSRDRAEVTLYARPRRCSLRGADTLVTCVCVAGAVGVVGGAGLRHHGHHVPERCAAAAGYRRLPAVTPSEPHAMRTYLSATAPPQDIE